MKIYDEHMQYDTKLARRGKLWTGSVPVSCAAEAAAVLPVPVSWAAEAAAALPPPIAPACSLVTPGQSYSTPGGRAELLHTIPHERAGRLTSSLLCCSFLSRKTLEDEMARM